MKINHQHLCHAGHAVNARARGVESIVTNYPWLGTDMAFGTKTQRLREHPG